MQPTKKQLNQYKNTPIELTPKQIEKIQDQATEKALAVIVGMSMLAVRDEYGFGKVKVMRFHDRFMDMVDSYNKGYVNMKDVWGAIESEMGITFGEGSTKQEDV